VEDPFPCFALVFVNGRPLSMGPISIHLFGGQTPIFCPLTLSFFIFGCSRLLFRLNFMNLWDVTCNLWSLEYSPLFVSLDHKRRVHRKSLSLSLIYMPNVWIIYCFYKLDSHPTCKNPSLPYSFSQLNYLYFLKGNQWSCRK